MTKLQSIPCMNTAWCSKCLHNSSYGDKCYFRFFIFENGMNGFAVGMSIIGGGKGGRGGGLGG